MEHVNGRKFREKKKKNKVEEIQLANLASLGSLASKKRNILLNLVISKNREKTCIEKVNDQPVSFIYHTFFLVSLLILSYCLIILYSFLQDCRWVIGWSQWNNCQMQNLSAIYDKMSFSSHSFYWCLRVPQMHFQPIWDIQFLKQATARLQKFFKQSHAILLWKLGRYVKLFTKVY